MSKRKFIQLRKVHKRTCTFCVQEFMSSRKNTRCCSILCRNRSKYIAGRKAEDMNICGSTKGAISELVASSFLMTKGYDVFRALSPSCYCDIVAIKGTYKYEIDVKSGYSNLSQKLSFPKSHKRTGNVPDLYAVVERSNGKVFFVDFKSGEVIDIP